MATTTTHIGLTKPDYTDAADIAVINTNMDTVDTAITATKSDLGIVEDGNTATHSITAGQYVIWKGNLYTAKSAISTGTTLSTSNLTAVSNGGLNKLNDQIETLNDHFAPSMTSPAYINTSIPPNSIGRQTFTGSSNDPLPDGSTSGTMIANYIRFGAGSATNQRYGTLILNNNGETYVKSRGTDSSPYGTWHKVLYEEPFVQTKTYSCKYSLSIGGAKNITGTDLAVSTPTGYTPFAVLQFSSGTNAVMPRLVNGKSTGSNAVMSLYNVGSSAVSDASASIVIAYIKTSLISIN